MGNLLPTPSQSNPTTVNSSDPPPESEPATQSNAAELVTPNRQPSDPPPSQNPEEIQQNPPAKEFRDEQDSKGNNDAREEEDEEEGECGFCLYMKGGGCKDTFTEWEKCVEEGEKNQEDIAEKCFQLTAALKNCMEAHSDYYAPLLQAEKAAQEEAALQLDEEIEGQQTPTDESKSSSDN